MNKELALQTLTWAQARDRVSLVNKELAEIIDELNPDDSYVLYHASYKYGDEILVDGKMHYPTNDSDLVLFNDPSISKKIRSDLGYIKETNPMTLVLKNDLELFIPMSDRIVPFSLLKEGALFGVWGVLEHLKQKFLFSTPIPIWSMTAGARSIFALPKISEMGAFSRIKKAYNVNQDVPKSLYDHWDVFRKIANDSAFKQKWDTELLFFSKKWVDSIHDDVFQKLKFYISSIAWAGSDFWRNQFSWDLTFTHIQAKRGLKPCPYVADIVNHILAMSVGAVPGLSPLLDDATAPVKGLIEVLEDTYGSRYAPIIIGPKHFSIFDKTSASIFYSFQYQTALRLSQKSSSRSSILTDMYNVHSLVEKYIYEIQNSDLKIEDTALYELAKTVKFNFYHYSAENYSNIIDSNNVLDTNLQFQNALKLCKVQQFPKNAPFLNGCIEISM